VLGKLYNAFAVLSIAHMLALGALVGMLYARGRLTPERIEAIAKVLRGEDEQTEKASTEAGQTAENGQDADKKRSAEEIRRQREEDQLRRVLGERAYRDRVAQRRLLDKALQHLISAQERFEAEQARIRKELAEQRGKATDEGFEKQKKLVARLSPKLAKQHILMTYGQSPADAVRLLAALPESVTADILGQMKSPEELKVMHELLERLGKQTVDQFTPGSGKTAGN